ncbi:MAG: DUF1289 domain-containing protein [Steroidobacteraceae bacterium]
MSTATSTSPCIGVCRLTPAGICAGCGRLLDEIAAWSRMTGEQRREVRERAAARLKESPPTVSGPRPPP